MLMDYIQAAMSQARYDRLEDGSYYGEIPRFRGVWANSTSLECCRTQLQEVLDDWIVIGLQLGRRLPRLPGVRAFPSKARLAV
ncbi:MAG: type II toxin-antitoxin system HicB family antitoxin [Phycisphaerae bacterium]